MINKLCNVHSGEGLGWEEKGIRQKKGGRIQTDSQNNENGIHFLQEKGTKKLVVFIWFA